MRKETNLNYRKAMEKLIDEISSISEYQKFGDQIDEYSLKNISEEIIALKQEDDEIGTHNLDVIILKKIQKLYDMYIVIHPIYKHYYYKKEISKLEKVILAIRETDDLIKSSKSRSLQKNSWKL